MNDTTSASSRNTLCSGQSTNPYRLELLRRIIKKSVISLYCRGWLSMRATAWIFRHLNLKGV